MWAGHIPEDINFQGLVRIKLTLFHFGDMNCANAEKGQGIVSISLSLFLMICLFFTWKVDL